MAPAVGIDLGTTYSCVGVFRDDRIEVSPPAAAAEQLLQRFPPHPRSASEPELTFFSDYCQ